MVVISGKLEILLASSLKVGKEGDKLIQLDSSLFSFYIVDWFDVSIFYLIQFLKRHKIGLQISCLCVLILRSLSFGL